ncbi:MAG: FGGY family carbohydrate kinase [Chloroflexota bacterium]|nr:FGGY family carbohydrate kinase [Chloroflexota bacterium]
MRTAEDAMLAIDLGTSSVKTLILSRRGTILGRGQASYSTSHPRPGFDEQHVDDWLQAIIAATASARRFAALATIQAIAITGQMHGTVMLDRDGMPLHPAIIWSDRRASDLLPAIQTRQGPSLPTTIGGPLGTGYLALSMAWIRKHRPHLWNEVAHAILPTDLVGFLLTGILATDPSNAVSTGLLNAGTGTWDESLLTAFAIPIEWLPQLVPSGSQVGPLAPEAAEALDLPPGLPVIQAGGDAPVAAIGGGVFTGADAMITMSTGAQVIRPTVRYSPEPEGRWHTWPAALPPDVTGDRWLSVGATLNAGRAIDWIHRTLAPGTSLTDVLELAQSVPAGAANLLFLPYLAGERSPLLDPDARGAFIGLSDSHGPEHMVRAVLEGIALSLADTLDRMTPNTDRPDQIVVGGGGASREMRQIVANVIGVPLAIPPTPESSALGAARIGAHALGWIHLTDDQENQLTPGSIIHPVQAEHDIYHERLELFREAVVSTLPIMHKLQRRHP